MLIQIAYARYDIAMYKFRNCENNPDKKTYVAKDYVVA